MSLIEIIIVIVLIGARVDLRRQPRDRRQGSRRVQPRQVAGADAGRQGRAVPHGHRPPAGLAGRTGTAPGDASGWLGPYAKEAELKDPFGHPYEYRVPGEDGDFDLVILGKDGKPGGTSIDADFKYE